MATALGVDLACRSWRDVGFGEVTFDAQRRPTWTGAITDSVRRPNDVITAAGLANLIDRYAVEHEVGAVALDGPQGWRQPGAPPRKGVGRSCEYEALTQGKTGEYGRTYPQTQHRWIAFCVEVFDRLLATGRGVLVNDPAVLALPTLGGGRYYVLEVFPTSIWRSLGLPPLPGHAKASPHIVRTHAVALQIGLGLPLSAVTDHHDNLQGLVAALAGAAVLGGPCRPVPRGVAAFSVPANASGTVPEHRAEGLIWDAAMTEGQALRVVTPLAAAVVELQGAAVDSENPLLPDDRDDVTDAVMARGAALFQSLVDAANAGRPLGISYADFVAKLYDVPRFSEVAGRNYRPSDSTFVIRLAQAVTTAAGGRKTVTRGGYSIQAGMDSFIWSAKDIDRSSKAWARPQAAPPYTRDEWLRVFPDGARGFISR
jgi:hypothetical protein